MYKAIRQPVVALLAATISLGAWADPITGTTQLSYLAELVRQGNESLKDAQDFVDLQKQLTELKQAEAVRKVAGFGEDAFALTTALQDTRNILKDFEHPNEQVKRIMADMEAYAARYDRAANEDDALDALTAYADALRRLDDQYWTGTHQPNCDQISSYLCERRKAAAEDAMGDFLRQLGDWRRLQQVKDTAQKNQEQIASGLNANDAAIVTAADTSMLLQLAIQEEQARQEDEAERLQAEAEQQAVVEAILGLGVPDDE